ncbi:MAG: hypothetical protein N2746_08470 [Deltaproteobacteria bacterium]|nr:hypothetical protein [Deltaproteobacteria bacterium]
MDEVSNKVYGFEVSLLSDDRDISDLVEEVKRYIPGSSRHREHNVVVNLHLYRTDKCSECYYYTYTYDNDVFNIYIYGDYPLGIQYGIYAILEMLGYRFLSPYKGHYPNGIVVSEFEKQLEKDISKVFTPSMGIRGLHLHTLHPIEALYDVWLGSDTNNAFRIVDWLIKIRGNYIQWVALKDILKDERYFEWKIKTQKIIEYAHKRGVKVGINCLVFAASSLQNGYVVEEKSDLVFLKELDFDFFNLSFGEFIGTDPSRFISKVQAIVKDLKDVKPSISVTGTIHVGNFDNLWVEHNGEKMLYYFLIKYVEDVIPFVHTVMYFNLIEPSVGAYNHKTFKEHREFLIDYLSKEKKVVYKPESAYWVAFDNSVPLYLPVYLRSRYLDIELMNSKCISDLCKRNSGHVIFTSGWEWGYHQTDYLSTRISYRLSRSLKEEISNMFAPLGDHSEKIAAIVYELSEMQAEFLIGKRLAPYYAGVDAWVELGHKSGIIGQPDRIMVEEVNTLLGERREAFKKNVIENLKLFSEEMKALYERLQGIKKDIKNEFIDEVVDGIEIDYFRSVFVYNVYAAVFFKDTKYLSIAEDALDVASNIVSKRHGRLFYPNRDLILFPNENPTIYKFGYLKQPDQLCLFKRDLIKAKNVLNNGSEKVPSCIE